MFKSCKKRIIAAICTMVLLVSNCIPALAAEIDSVSEPAVTATITITNPETGEEWEWEVPASDIQTSSATASTYSSFSELLLSDNESESVDTAAVAVDVSNYIALVYPSQSSTKTDKITISTGLSYSYNTSTKAVSLKTTFGSIQQSGLYYASNRSTWYKNMGSGAQGIFYPTSNSWSYATDPLDGLYNSELPPYSSAECRVYVSGMEPMYVIITVTCNLDL